MQEVTTNGGIRPGQSTSGHRSGLNDEDFDPEAAEPDLSTPEDELQLE